MVDGWGVGWQKHLKTVEKIAGFHGKTNVKHEHVTLEKVDNN